MTRVGVLALQGDVREHVRLLEEMSVEPVAVKHPEQLGDVDGLVIPGGESTTIGKMAVRFGLLEPIRQAISDGLPVYGTCAGMILLAGSVTEGDQPLIGGLDIVVRRNAFGRQNDSFESEIQIEGMDDPFPAVFIRAPWVEKVGADVQVMAEVSHHAVMVRHERLLATSFHPEIAGDDRVHRVFVEMIEE
jgi:5'-phosphate synthase pdxT subunit